MDDCEGSYGINKSIHNMTDMEQVTQVANGVSDYSMMAVTAAVSCVAVVFIGIAKEFYDFFSGEEFDLHDSSVLPLKFKMGEDADGNVVYHTFETVDELGRMGYKMASI